MKNKETLRDCYILEETNEIEWCGIQNWILEQKRKSMEKLMESQ